MRRKLQLRGHLGGGTQGIVYSTHSTSAIKAFRQQLFFDREVAVYKRLKERNVNNVCGFWVPRPLNYNAHLLIVEMETVKPPFVVDFASAGVDGPLEEYPPDVIEAWEAEKRELFEDDWPTVQRVIAGFKAHGIFLSDLKYGNIEFARNPI